MIGEDREWKGDKVIDDAGMMVVVGSIGVADLMDEGGGG